MWRSPAAANAVLSARDGKRFRWRFDDRFLFRFGEAVSKERGHTCQASCSDDDPSHDAKRHEVARDSAAVTEDAREQASTDDAACVPHHRARARRSAC